MNGGNQNLMRKKSRIRLFCIFHLIHKVEFQYLPSLCLHATKSLNIEIDTFVMKSKSYTERKPPAYGQKMNPVNTHKIKSRVKNDASLTQNSH